MRRAAHACILLAFLGAVRGEGDVADDGRDLLHRLVMTLDPVAEADGAYPVVEGPIAFNEAIVSWNVDVPTGAGCVFEARVARGAERDAAWSPWLKFGRCGDVIDAAPTETEFADGKVDVDVFKSKMRFERIQVRMRRLGDAAAAANVRVPRLAICLSDTLPDRGLTPHHDGLDRVEPRRAVPYRSQHAVDASIARRVCSPTCVAMVMEAYGVARTTEEVAARSFDAEHDIYGNWTNAVQAAYSFGVPGYVDRFENIEDARRFVNDGKPLIVTVAFESGALRGAPMESTKGHLIVLTGVTDRGDFTVNDPAARDAKSGQTVYRAEDLAKVWIERNGVAYVLLDPSAEEPK